jgi:MFS family permease
MRRLMVMVSAIVLVDTMFYAAISPLLPYYAHHFHLAKSQVGLLAAAYAAGTLIGSIPAGWLAVRLGVRAAVVTGLTLMIVASFAFGFARQIVVLDCARFVQGLGGAGSWAAGLAWLIDRAPAGRRGEVIGTTLSAAIVGALLGPVLGTIATQTSPAARVLAGRRAGRGAGHLDPARAGTRPRTGHSRAGRPVARPARTPPACR